METIKSYRVRRRLKFGEEYREWGELAPELHLYRRVDSHVHAGNVDFEEMDLEEFHAGVATYCPELAEQIYAALKLEPPAKPEPVAPREELEALKVSELRELAKAAGLETKKKAEIIEALSEPEPEPEE